MSCNFDIFNGLCGCFWTQNVMALFYSTDGDFLGMFCCLVAII